jgi:hypothetical protein
MDDIFSGAGSFEGTYAFTKDHLLPRLVWAKFKLFFKKMRLCMLEVDALGLTHLQGGKVIIKKSRVEKIKDWAVPRNKSEVLSFLRAILITRRVRLCSVLSFAVWLLLLLGHLM